MQLDWMLVERAVHYLEPLVARRENGHRRHFASLPFCDKNFESNGSTEYEAIIKLARLLLTNPETKEPFRKLVNDKFRESWPKKNKKDRDVIVIVYVPVKIKKKKRCK